MATDPIAADTARIAEDARCYRHPSTSGEWVTLCPLPPGVVVYPPYKPSSRHNRYSSDARDPSDRRGHSRTPR